MQGLIAGLEKPGAAYPADKPGGTPLKPMLPQLEALPARPPALFFPLLVPLLAPLVSLAAAVPARAAMDGSFPPES